MALADRKKEIDSFASLTQLYPTPEVLARASSLVNDSTSNTEDIARLIQTDASLTTDVIRLSNSAAYGFSTQATNLAEAIARVGYQEVLRVLALSVSRQLIAQDLECYGITAQQQWDEAISVAILMEQLAQRVGEDPYDAYTIGVLHTVGRILINEMLKDVDERCPSDANVTEWEEEQTGFNYAYAGFRLLRHWKFSNLISQPVLYHLNAHESVYQLALTESLAFARDTLQKAGCGFENTDAEFNQWSTYTAAYHLSEDEYRSILKRSRHAYLKFKDMLSM